MRQILFLVCLVVIEVLLGLKGTVLGNTSRNLEAAGSKDQYSGSTSCKKCHAKFYELWEPSWHGLAMRLYTSEFKSRWLTPQSDEIVIGESTYRADIGGLSGWVVERNPKGENKYRIDYVMGGKNVFYFLTTLHSGRVQTLPLAYDTSKKKWFDMAASGVRHFSGHTEVPVNWKSWQYTFNTSCYACHVSQVSTNYDRKSDSYNTKWKETGINCETCHGPAGQHVRVCEDAPKGTIPKDLKIVRGGRDFTHEQNNSTCSVCHAKSISLGTAFRPGDIFFDHFDLVTLEDPDFYPDGRDLGENYTYTSWLMSPCAKSGKLDCLHCHTSSGRYKFRSPDKANLACMPCHADKVNNSVKHTRHKTGSPGNRCVACHMPTTVFARMSRSDHSMLPPVPRATIAYKSPNACNVCHTDRDAIWADNYVRKWRSRNYQEPLLKRADLVDAARRHDWSKLPEMLEYITDNKRDEIFATSLVRLVPASGDSKILPALLKASSDPSPLVRSAAAESMQNIPEIDAVNSLIKMTGDSSRLVRVRAAGALVKHKGVALKSSESKTVESASREFLGSLVARSDQWDSHYNLGNYYLDCGQVGKAIASYNEALRIEPDAVPAMVNSAMAYVRLGEKQKADEMLERALTAAPANAEANFNMGLLKAEENDTAAAEKFLRTALRIDPTMAQAAYNLGVLISGNDINEAVNLCKKAVELRPNEPRFAYTLAFYQIQKGDLVEAAHELESMILKFPDYADTYLLLGNIYEKQGRTGEAEKLYNSGILGGRISYHYQAIMKNRLEKLGSSPRQ